MLLGYMRVSKSDGSQSLDLQRDALLAAGVAPERLYEDHASGRQDERPGLAACLKALQPGNTATVYPFVASRNLLLYQSLPSSIPYRHANVRRRKDDPGMGTAARSITA